MNDRDILNSPVLVSPVLVSPLAQRRAEFGLAFAGKLASVIRGLRRSLREHALFITAVILYLLAGVVVSLVMGRPMAFAFTIGQIAAVLWAMGLWLLLFAMVIEAVIAVRSGAQGRPLQRIWRRISSRYLRADRLWGGLAALALFTALIHNFFFMKSLLPILHKFDWDPTLAAWDRWLHFGREPWEWLQPILGHPPVTSAISYTYAIWFFVLYGVTVWQAFSRRDPVLRMQFLLTSVLIWVLLGNIAAVLLASGGPVYYGRLTGLADPYAPLMGYLQASAKLWPNVELGAQEFLWQTYLTNGQGGRLTALVSAMPSMHVATSCSFFLLARATHRWLGIVFGLFLLTILLGSVHLGWHYAIDGYAGILGTVILWWACGKVLGWRPVHRLLWGDESGLRAQSVAARIRAS